MRREDTTKLPVKKKKKAWKRITLSYPKEHRSLSAESTENVRGKIRSGL